MEEDELDVGRIYGHVVCLVAVLIFVLASATLTGGILDLREPPYTETYRDGPTLVSFGAYRVEMLSRLKLDGTEGAMETLLPSDSTLQEMYEKERLYRLALSHQASRRTITVSLVLMGVAVLLFLTHWGWFCRRKVPGRTENP